MCINMVYGGSLAQEVMLREWLFELPPRFGPRAALTAQGWIVDSARLGATDNSCWEGRMELKTLCAQLRAWRQNHGSHMVRTCGEDRCWLSCGVCAVSQTQTSSREGDGRRIRMDFSFSSHKYIGFAKSPLCSIVA